MSKPTGYTDSGDTQPEAPDSPAYQAQNPFIVLEALGEHVQSAWYELGKLVGRPRAPLTNRGHLPSQYPISSPEYHLACIEQYEKELFHLLTPRLPAEYRAYDGDSEATP